MSDNPASYYEKLGRDLAAYCKKFLIPPQYFFEIINDQKVNPMLRGKGMEYAAYLLLDQLLDSRAWKVTKLNLSAQPGILDQDISLTHSRTGIQLIVESKSAVRGSIRAGPRSKHKVPHFKVKCHRSRSSIGREGNDRYLDTAFDILLSNPLNALFQGGTVGEDLELIKDQNVINLLYQHYGVSDEEALLNVAANDWRFVLPPNISENSFIPRTPTVFLSDDPHWLSLAQLQGKIEEVVRERLARKRSGRS